VKIGIGNLVPFVFLLVLCGCGSRKKGVDWTSEAIVFSNRVATVYWKAEEWVDGSRLSNRLKGRVTKHRTARHFLISRLNLDTRECVEEFVPETMFQDALLKKEECLRNSTPVKLTENLRVLDANCVGGYILMGYLFADSLVIIHGDDTRSPPDFGPSTLMGKAGINERGEVFFVGFDAGNDQGSQARVPFAVFRDGKWWTGHIPGKMPELGNKDWARTSTVPALVEMPIGQ
jgi:hypothetical protein